MKTKLKITHNGFHGYHTHTVLGQIDRAEGWSRGCGVPEGYTVEGWQVSVSKAGAEKFRCKQKDCRCGESLPETFWVPLGEIDRAEVSYVGLYPQA